MYYQELLQTLTPPWDSLFKHTHVLANDNTGILVVQEHQYNFFCSLEALIKIYPIVKKLYPDIKSLFVVYGPQYDYIKDGHMEIVNVKVKLDNEYT